MSQDELKNEEKKGSKWVTFIVVLTKSSKLIKVFKTAKILKPLITFVSMAASVFVYSFGLGLWFAVGFVVMLFIHEMGHVMALKRKGLPASAPVFIPMLGAVIFAPDMGDRHDEAYMGYAGPLVGGAAAALLLGVVAIVPDISTTWIMICWTAIFLNLFNLIPIRPLDGGRVTQAIGPWFKFIGVALLLGLTVLMKSPGILLIWILVLGDFRLGKYRSPLGWTIQGIMMFMMIFGIGEDQPLWIDILDVVIATLFNLMYLAGERYVDEGILSDDRPHLPKHHKIRWFGLYATLSIALIVLMVFATSYLPPEVVNK